MGCWAFGGGEYWGPQDENAVDRTVRRAVELGVNYFDAAEVYNQGRSEKSLGLAIRGLPRDRLLIGTKISPNNTEPETLRAHCEASLRRLGTDYIDLYMVHWPVLPQAIVHFSRDGACPSPLAAFAALGMLQQQGKIRYVGVSNFGVEPLEPETIALLDEATAPLWRKLGQSFDYYEHTDHDRTRPLKSPEALKRIREKGQLAR
jgi:aryl-alcohol dehydrogenase-like predicted oxidoreductase